MKEVDAQQLTRALTPRKAGNIARAAISYAASRLSRTPKVWNSPVILTVEPSNRCNLRCPQCATGAGKIKRPFENFQLSLFKKVIDELKDELLYLLLFNQGEPYLHPEFIDFVTYAKKANIYVTTSTNGHFFDDEAVVRRTVASGLDTLVISLDGADAATYEKYRNGGNFETVIEGIRAIAAEKRVQRRRTPILLIQFLVMRHNEHQVEEIKKLAADLGANRVLLKTVQVDSAESAAEFLPAESRYRRYILQADRLKMKKKPSAPCRRLWLSAVLNSNGCVSPCCFDKDGAYAFGAVTQDTSFASIWHSDAYNSFRQDILNGKAIDICQNCTEGTKIFF